YLEGSAASRLAGNGDVAAALLHDAVDGSQAEAGAAAFALGREERLEDALHRLAVHPAAGVAHVQHDVGARLDDAYPADGRLVDADVAGGDPQASAARHRVASIDHQVQ